MTTPDFGELLNVTPLANVSAGANEMPSRLATSIGASVMLAFFVQGIVGNLWIICGVFVHRKMWTVINIFITSLCVNDLLSLCLIVILIIDSYIWRRWTAGEVMCKLNPEFTVAFIGCSLWHTALIAIHRYIVVVHNNIYKKMKRNAYVVFVLVMARAIPVACAVPGFSLDSSGYVPKMLRCILLPTQKARIISVTVIQVIVPCVVVVFCYLLIFGFVYRTSRQLNLSNNNMRREIQITKMFGIIFLMILLGFIPYTAVRNADRGNRFGADVYVIISVFYAIATCSSPLVYGFMSRDIQESCLAFLARIVKVLKLQKCSKCLKPHEGYIQPTDGQMETNAEMVTWTESKTQTDL
ncbi:hypothetical protein LSH36_1084g00005 [Paralvinella palmiformis]|uniref:G-protein coupled receptors family 1 profile domain-containing protein n=1 Tax=Paralvinella palmiformis TaxID=53620 RepID=A0AAD9MPV2_9ANNE|nr:hypothetical protein LSH36_1084g00005 [Paralvinella palmiformis]